MGKICKKYWFYLVLAFCILNGTAMAATKSEINKSIKLRFTNNDELFITVNYAVFPDSYGPQVLVVNTTFKGIRGEVSVSNLKIFAVIETKSYVDDNENNKMNVVKENLNQKLSQFYTFGDKQLRDIKTNIRPGETITVDTVFTYYNSLSDCYKIIKLYYGDSYQEIVNSRVKDKTDYYVITIINDLEANRIYSERLRTLSDYRKKVQSKIIIPDEYLPGKDNIEQIKEYLEKNPDMINMTFYNGDTFLYRSTIGDSNNFCITPIAYDFIEYFIKKGANVNIRNKKGKTPLNNFIYKTNEYIIVNCYAKVVQNKQYEFISVPADGGMHKRILELFISSGADVNARDNEGNTPLLIASEIYKTYSKDFSIRIGVNSFYKNVVEYLISHGAK